MKQLFFLSLLLSYSSLVAGEVFPSCATEEPAELSDSKGLLPVSKVQPKYPKAALQRLISGHVLVSFTVTAEGRTTGFEIVESEPADIFNKAAIAAAKFFVFEPRKMDGVAVETLDVRNRIIFFIHDERSGTAIKKVKKLLEKGKAEKASAYLDKRIAKEEGNADSGNYLRTLQFLSGTVELQRQNTEVALGLLLSATDQCEKFCPLDRGFVVSAASSIGNIKAAQGKWDESLPYYALAVQSSRKELATESKIRSFTTNHPETVSTFAKFAIASFQTRNWCSAKHGFKTAISNGVRLGMETPARWSKGLKIAEMNLQKQPD